MELVQQLSLPGSVSSVACDADGARVAVAVGMSAPYLYRPKDAAPDPQVHLCRVSGGDIHQDTVLRLRPGGETPTTLKDGKVAFLDEQTLLVAARVVRGVTDEDVTLIGLDCEKGEERGRWVWPTFLQRILSDIVALPPRHALLSLAENVVCVNVETFQELCRAREVEDGDVVEEDAVPEERLAPNGFVYDPAGGRTYLLCRAFGEAILLRCRLDLPARAFVREAREAFSERQDCVGLCLTPGGGLTALLQVADEWVDLAGRPVSGGESTRAVLLAQPRLSYPPRTTRLGSLVLFPSELRGAQRRIDFDSDFARDFDSEPYSIEDGTGQAVHVGYRLTSGDVRLTLAHGDFLTKPVYIDDHRCVFGTPSGLLLCVDTAAGHSEVVHDCHARINTLQFQPQQRLLFVGCEDGTLTVLSVPLR